MGIAEWLTFAGLLVTIAFGGGGVIWKLSTNKTEIIEKIGSEKDSLKMEVDAVRMAASVEYKEIRYEMAGLVAKAYLELGEAPKALREHVNSMELWMRDNLLPRKEYERDQDQILKAIEKLQENMDTRFSAIDRKLERGG